MKLNELVGSIITHDGPIEVRLKTGGYGVRACTMTLVHVQDDGHPKAAAHVTFVDPEEVESVSMALADAAHLMRLP